MYICITTNNGEYMTTSIKLQAAMLTIAMTALVMFALTQLVTFNVFTGL